MKNYKKRPKREVTCPCGKKFYGNGNSRWCMDCKGILEDKKMTVSELIEKLSKIRE